MDFERAVKYLKAFVSFEDLEKIEYSDEKFDLSRVRDFLRDYGVDFDSLKYVHVAGSKGKGSVCQMIGDYLNDEGLKVGVFTSPYMFDITECFWLSGEKISKEAFSEMVAELKKFIDLKGCNLTYFELLTVLVLKYFVDSGVDYAVLEVGLGGRLDSTNVVNSEVAVITAIELEHVGILGNTLEDIVREKLGIVKAGCKVVVGPQSRESLEIIRKHLGDVEWKYVGDFEGNALDINAKTVEVVLLELFGEVDEVRLKKVVENFSLPGRFEVREVSGKTVVFDMAHTISSIKNLAENLKNRFYGKRFVFLISVMKDKKAKEILDILSELGGDFVFTSAHETRALDPFDLQKLLGGGSVCIDCKEAFNGALSELKRDQVMVVTGSHFLISKIGLN